jgi:Glyoxalase/Bleomycin resistance protein/Dioxygenase superfamily
MQDLSVYQERREALKVKYLPNGDAAPQSVQTVGVDHLALICSELERTIGFYSEVLGMRLTRIVQNRASPPPPTFFSIWAPATNWRSLISRKKDRRLPYVALAACITLRSRQSRNRCVLS